MARPTPIILSEAERSELEGLIRSHSTPQHLARRARMIVMAADYFNRTMAKPFKWTWAGKPLTI